MKSRWSAGRPKSPGARFSGKAPDHGVLRGAWRLHPERDETADVSPWLGAGGEGDLQAWLVGPEGRRNALQVDGCRGKRNLPGAWFSGKTPDHGVFGGSIEAPLNGDETAKRFADAVARLDAVAASYAGECNRGAIQEELSRGSPGKSFPIACS
jgi:hypothetical protein